MCILHDCRMHLKPYPFCIVHKTFTRWFPQNIQQLTAPNSNPSFLSVSLSHSNPPLKAWHQNISNKSITTRQPTPCLPPWQTYGIHSPDCNEHDTLSIQPRVSPVPCDWEREGASVTAGEAHITSTPNTQGSYLTGSSPTSSEARWTGSGMTLFVIMPWASRTAQIAAAVIPTTWNKKIILMALIPKRT